MATTLQHACSRRSDTHTESRIFRNDANSVAALHTARIQKKLMEEAARLQQQKLNKAAGDLQSQTAAKKKVEEERDALRREKETLTKAVKLKEGELKGSKNEVARLKSAREALEKQKEKDAEALKRQKQEVDTVTRQKQGEYDALKMQLDASENMRRDLKSQLDSTTAAEAQRGREIQSLKQTIDSLERKVPNSRLDNCLPFQYHNSTVMFVHLDSQMALSAEKEDNTKAHGWTYDMTDGNQIFTLRKVGGQPKQDNPWTITRTNNGKSLQFINGEEDWDVRANYPKDCPGRQEYWFIGRGSSDRVGSWVIKNAEWGTCIELSAGGRTNGLVRMGCLLAQWNPQGQYSAMVKGQALNSDWKMGQMDDDVSDEEHGVEQIVISRTMKPSSPRYQVGRAVAHLFLMMKIRFCRHEFVLKP